MPTTLTTSPSAHARADRVPMRIERADRNRNAGAQARACPPILRESVPGDLIGSRDSARRAFRERRSSSGSTPSRKSSGGNPPSDSFHIHLWPMAQTLRGACAGSVMPHKHRGDHVAMFKAPWPCGRACRGCAAASAAAWRSPTRTSTCRRTSRSPRAPTACAVSVISAASRQAR